ncbi:hypothetical protein ATANTOWER_025767 [Ataeniobius toweri]|uniref:Uncharacterized protein n=1 Tax=Ataeniobius toweri TaxID=208326 RepID=A0ABU7AMD7_9TELE|nr:hypothetical protein [Ataeniobius toweri]
MLTVTLMYHQVQDKFRLDLSDEEAVHYMQSLIDESVGALFAAVVEQIHKFAQVSLLYCLINSMTICMVTVYAVQGFILELVILMNHKNFKFLQNASQLHCRVNLYFCSLQYWRR